MYREAHKSEGQPVSVRLLLVHIYDTEPDEDVVKEEKKRQCRSYICPTGAVSEAPGISKQRATLHALIDPSICLPLHRHLGHLPFSAIAPAHQGCCWFPSPRVWTSLKPSLVVPASLVAGA